MRYIDLIPYFLLLICFMLYQFGLSYHFSFGSFGLLLLALFVFRSEGLPQKSTLLAIFFVTLILLSYFVHLNNYIDAEPVSRIVRFCFTAAMLVYLLGSMKQVFFNLQAFLISALLLFFLSVYQVCVDHSFTPPASWFALDTEVSDSVGLEYILSSGGYRAAGLYSEPSVLGLLSCCFLYVFLKTRKINYLSYFGCAVSVCSVFMSGSMLGFVGILMVFTAVFYREKGPFLLFSVLPVTPLLYVSIMFFTSGRSFEHGGIIDDSTAVRLFYPFILIYENFNNNDWLGFLGDAYSHFMYTGVYNSRGEFPGHNGFLSLILSYGISGVLMIVLVFKNLRSIPEVVIVFLIGSQSGNFFSYEKVFLMAYMVGVSRNLER